MGPQWTSVNAVQSDSRGIVLVTTFDIRQCPPHTPVTSRSYSGAVREYIRRIAYNIAMHRRTAWNHGRHGPRKAISQRSRLGANFGRVPFARSVQARYIWYSTWSASGGVFPTCWLGRRRLMSADDNARFSTAESIYVSLCIKHKSVYCSVRRLRGHPELGTRHGGRPSLSFCRVN